MAWNTQPRTLDVVCDAFPKYYEQDMFVGARLCGSEKLGRLADYEVDVSTIEAHGLYVNEMHKYVDLNRLVGSRLTVKIAIEGNGTWQNGAENERSINLGADIRHGLTGWSRTIHICTLPSKTSEWRIIHETKYYIFRDIFAIDLRIRRCRGKRSYSE